jgi:hypothetical protein
VDKVVVDPYLRSVAAKLLRDALDDRAIVVAVADEDVTHVRLRRLAVRKVLSSLLQVLCFGIGRWYPGTELHC